MITPAQLREMEIRLYGLPPKAKASPTAVEDESDLHNAIIQYCREKGWGYLHGSMAHRTRRTLGEMDFVIMAERSQLRLVECKSKNGKLSTDQQAFIAQARRNGHVIHIVRSMEEFRLLFV